ncbi:MAG: response regulator [Gallionella sp.]|nr:response regulator [Gallionella sp.]
MKPPPCVMVLVLDDHPSLRRNLLALLEDEGFEVMEAASGEEALQMVQHRRVDAVIVDIRLPGMNGNEFIVAAHAIRPALRFVIHTGAMDYILPDELRRLGLTDGSVFIKPVSDINALFSLLRGFNEDDTEEI